MEQKLCIRVDTGISLNFTRMIPYQIIEDRKSSCTGYYLINGSLLEKPVYEFVEMEFTLADADKYDILPDDGGDTDGGDDAEPTGPPVSRRMRLSIRRERSQV